MYFTYPYGPHYSESMIWTMDPSTLIMGGSYINPDGSQVSAGFVANTRGAVVMVGDVDGYVQAHPDMYQVVSFQ